MDSELEDHLAKKRLSEDFDLHATTRAENDQLLSSRIPQIETASDTETLARFAKAYLGMYLDINNDIPPDDRLKVLAGSELEQAVYKGFTNILTSQALPSLADIADSYIHHKPMDIGYIVLAGIQRTGKSDEKRLLNLPKNTLQLGICFHFANKTEMVDNWMETVFINDADTSAKALGEFWHQLIKRGAESLPGLYDLISHQKYDPITTQLILPIVQQWPCKNPLIVRDLLHTAIRISDHDALLACCEAPLNSSNPSIPKLHILWLATAFLLDPNTYHDQLSEYVSRSKEKLLPLLDYIVMILLTVEDYKLKLDSQIFAWLLELIAPKFAPQTDNYGNLCDNTQKVLLLFYRLATSTDKKTQQVISRLGQIRVMKIYKHILDYTAKLNQRSSQQIHLEAFIDDLKQQGLIKSRRKWFDRS